MKTPIRAVIVDDHPIVVAGARALIEASEDIVCVGVANTGAEALSLISEATPDIIVLDVSLPDVSGLTLAKKIIDDGHPGHIVMMTLFDERKYVDEALRIGARGFVQKRSAEQNLLMAIRTAMLGGLFLDPPTAIGMNAPAIAEVQPQANMDLSVLTKRELEVLKMVALG
jgi:DNA-binding NarL/FixJ family response regulator